LRIKQDIAYKKHLYQNFYSITVIREIFIMDVTPKYDFFADKITLMIFSIPMNCI